MMFNMFYAELDQLNISVPTRLDSQAISKQRVTL